jgi:hypothetical protein
MIREPGGGITHLGAIKERKSRIRPVFSSATLENGRIITHFGTPYFGIDRR